MEAGWHIWHASTMQRRYPMHINSDLHIHSKYSAATSRHMELKAIASEAKKKGIQLVGTGDCLHPRWLEEAKAHGASDGVFEVEGTHFVLTVEVEDRHRVHHLIILPDAAKAEELHDRLHHFSRDIDADGRPRLQLSGDEVVEHAIEVDGLVGPCHAFTPWTALYAYFDSLRECYKDMAKHVAFLELGLSADSDYADTISELSELTFLSNSDAHSPWLNKFAREFNRFEVRDITFDELKKAILRRGGRKPVLNVGFFPEEGKYNRTACTRCYRQYALDEAIGRGWRCECGGLIKKGVRDRVRELATYDVPHHPPHRPPYVHTIPLAEVVKLAIGKGVNTASVREIWLSLIEQAGSEIAALIDVPLDSLEGVDERVIRAIGHFREGKLIIEPGGGGRYGVVSLPEEDGFNSESTPQRTLLDF